MNPSTVNESARVRLERIAAEYRMQGYEVQIEPQIGSLPEFLSGFAPDFIASGRGESVVVKVKTRGELADSPVDTRLEAAVQNRPGWRFELIIDGTAGEKRQSLSTTQIRALLEESVVLERQKHSAAALMVLWSAAEGALRLLANRESIELESFSPGYLLTRLYTLGLLGRAQYQALDTIMRKRNGAAHGYQVSVVSDDLVASMAALNDLLNEVETKAA